MSTTHKTLLTLLIVGVVGALAGIGTFSAFSSTTDSTGNQITAGTVDLVDNDTQFPMYDVSNQAPGDPLQRCITLTYLGTMDADVRLYTTSTVGELAGFIDLTVEAGTGSGGFPDCSGFSPVGDALYEGTLEGFATNHGGWDGGIAASPGSQSHWSQNDSLVYRFTLTLLDEDDANGGEDGPLSTGEHSFTWEARRDA